MRRRSSGAVCAAVAFSALAPLVGVACASTGDPSTPVDVRGGLIPGPLLPDAGALAASEASGDAACNVRIDVLSPEPGVHVPVGTPVVYDTNPPSSGEHYPIWANFQEFSAPVPDPYMVHSMEHGAVVLFYKCAPPCDVDATLEVLRAVREAVPPDPLCSPDIGVRVIIAPRPALDDMIGAAAWGVTYRAECADLASLTAFTLAHYDQGPEHLCAPGQTTF